MHRGSSTCHNNEINDIACFTCFNQHFCISINILTRLHDLHFHSNRQHVSKFKSCKIKLFCFIHFFCWGTSVSVINLSASRANTGFGFSVSGTYQGDSASPDPEPYCHVIFLQACLKGKVPGNIKNTVDITGEQVPFPGQQNLPTIQLFTMKH